MTVRGVVFDFGGVLAGTISNLTHDAGRHAGVDGEEWQRLIGLLPYETTPGNMWHEMEVGRASGEEWAAWYAARVTAATGRPVDADKVLARVRAGVRSMVPNEDVLARVRRAKDLGLPIAVCTNNADHLEWRHLVPLELFDAVIDSSEVGHRKPDPQIFDLTCAAIGVAPADAVLLDDFPGNVDGARRFGMRAILVGPDRAAALAELDTMLDAVAVG